MKEPTGRQHSSAGEAPNMWYTVMADLGTNACGTRLLNKGRGHVSESSTEGRRNGREERKEGEKEGEETGQNMPRSHSTPTGRCAFEREGLHFCL